MADTRNYTDFQLLFLLKGDDHDAFTEIYNRYNLVLLQHAYSKLRNREEARDLVQEAFSKLWERREAFKSIKTFPVTCSWRVCTGANGFGLF